MPRFDDFDLDLINLKSEVNVLKPADVENDIVPAGEITATWHNCPTRAISLCVCPE